MTRGRHVRTVVLAAAAILFGGLAASLVSGREARVRAQVGPLVPVVVAARDIPAGRTITPDTQSRLLVERRVPASFAPPRALRHSSEAVGFQPGVDLAAGDYVTSGSLEARVDGEARESAVRAGAGRLIEVAVSGASSLLERFGPGARVDVLVTSDRAGRSHSYLALQNVPLIAVATDASGSSSGSGESPADAMATLRVSLREALILTAAQNFAREIRLVPRPEGEQELQGPASVAASELRP